MGVAQQVADVVKPHVGVKSRGRIVRARFAVRRATEHLRLLPDFLVLGTMRGGTSSLYKYLSQHPEVSPSLRKEVEYFTRYYDCGETWYRRHFPLRPRRQLVEGLGRRLTTFEATPYYLFEPRCAGRAHALLPSARLVVLLRDPVERAFSHFQHMTRLGFENLSFAEALAAEERRITPELTRMADEPTYFSHVHHRYSYLARGRYAEQIERWLEVYPRSSMLIVDSNELYTSPADCFARIQGFLGLSQWQPPGFRNYSYVGRAPSRSRIDARLRQELRLEFADDERRLEGIWGQVPSWRDEA